jgi:RND superfamily putative drug exporter
MRWLARFATRWRWPVLAVWGALFVVALAAGPSARHHLHQTNLQIPGTQADRVATLSDRQFGGPVAMAVLLKGPPALVERRGPRIVADLQRIPGVRVLSPWAIGGARVLREPPGQALLTIQVRRPFQTIINDTTPAVERVLARDVRAPMSDEVSGLSPLVRAINRASLHALDVGELIALPILLVMLLLIFRSPLAALVPAISGLLVTRIGTALMGVIAHRVEVDALALNMVAMIGLALGVDYSLLIVSRFREELANGRDVPEAIEEVTARAGRTVLFAGSALSLGMLGALLIAPGALLVSSTIGLIVATVMAVLVALLAMPAGLAALGTGIDRWQFGTAALTSPWVRIAERALRRPGVAAFFTLLPLLVLAGPAVALNTGPPNVANLPPHDSARRSFEAFQRDRGAGWAAPFEVDFKADGPITTNARLAALGRFQDRVSRLPGVDAVLGPASLSDRATVLRRVTRQALSGTRALAQFERGLRAAGGGTAALRDGLAVAAAGSGLLVQGLGQTASGSGQLSRGVHQAAPRTRVLAQGIAATGKGSRQIAKGLQRVLPGVARLQRNLDTLQQSLTEEDRHAAGRLLNPLDSVQSHVQEALRQLGSASPAAAADPAVQRAKQEITSALLKLGDISANLSNATTTLDANAIAARAIFRGERQLSQALGRLADGSTKLEAGIGRTSAGASQLAGGVRQLDSGAAQLDAAVRALLDGQGGSGGARALASGLDDAVSATNQLGQGVQRILGGVVRVRVGAQRQQAQLRASGTDVGEAVDSGYFVLAAVQGAQQQTQTNISFATNSASGGDTARVIVVPRRGPFDAQSSVLAGRLQREAARTGRALRAEALVGGPAILLQDFNSATKARFPWLVAMLVAVTFLVLLLVFRSPVLALCAVILNLVTVGAAVGVLVICFQGDGPLLGGPGYLDAISLSGICAIIFGLSIDYEVFLIARLVEGRELTGTTEGAIRYGLQKTATIITGAALIMAAVFLAFAASPVTNTRQFGVGLTVAVLIDATLVRLILLPALIRLFGERTWAVPGWLERALPRLGLH